MKSRMYDGTAAYKIDDYYSYREQTQQKQEEVRAENTHKKNKLSVVNRKKLVCVVSAVFVLAIAFLYLNVVLIQTADEYEDAVAKLDDIRVRNTQTSFEIASGVDLAVVEEKAKNEFGMQQPESHQNVYVEVVQSDYAETVSDDVSEIGTIDKMILAFKSFLAYIG